MAADSTRKHVHVFESLGELSSAAAGAFANAAAVAVRERGRFSVALAGGGTPQTLYRLLAANSRDSIPWNDVHLFFSDERFVSRDDRDSNYRMVDETLLASITIPGDNVHRPLTERYEPHECAQRYESTVRLFFGSQPPSFDWMLLGLGTDGHVGSLFPGSAALEETERLVVAIDDSPKPPPIRVTMTLPLINASSEVHFLVAGRDKRAVLLDVLKGADHSVPARCVQPVYGSVDWWVDRDAAGNQV